MGRIWLVCCVVAACGADPAKPVAPGVPATPPVQADAAVAEIDTGKDETPDATKPCFCFSWVHLDENGQSCYPTKTTCDAEFTAFGRSTKIPCGKETDRCSSYACRNIGKECFKL